MSKFNISFNGKNYSIDKSLLSGAVAELETLFDGLNTSVTENIAILDEAVLDYCILE